MRAVVYAGPGEVRVDDVSEPRIEEQGDAVVAVELTAICGSDLHLLTGKTPGMKPGGVIGHEFVGTISERGSAVSAFPEGTRVVGSFLIACGVCRECRVRRFNHCVRRRALGLGPVAGDLEGAQAEYVRVPDADVNLRALGDASAGLSNEAALFSGDILATGFYAAALVEAGPGETVAVMGAGPVGLCAALALGTRDGVRVVILDSDAGRVAFARGLGLDAVDVSGEDAEAAVAGRTGDVMADAVIEAVGAAPAFRSAMRCVRNGGRVAVVGVYGKERYDLPMGATWVRGLDLRFSGMANIQNHWAEALSAVASGAVDPTRLITHRLPLDQAPEGYELFRSRTAMKVVLTP
jgi:threonine dehydrogenase-like Zn-dependent dehydrogenase